MEGYERRLNRISLGGKWKLSDFNPGERECRTIFTEDLQGSRWMDADVPGDIHDVLLKYGRLPDPFFGDNIKKCRWTLERDWFYVKDLSIEKDLLRKKIELVFKGIDTYGHIWLNGSFLGSTRNMFLEYVFDVTDIIKAGQNNRLVVHFDAFSERLRKEAGPDFKGTFKEHRVFIRKTQCQFGWDWAPVLPAIGIWRDVEMVSYDGCRIKDVCVRTNMNGQVDIFTELSKALGDGKLFFEVSDRKQKNQAVIPVNGLRAFHSFMIKNPKLWFPRGYGEPALYNYKVKYLGKTGNIIDEHTGRFGIRTVETFEEPFKPNGLSFGIKVNGIRIFCKGGNWIPADTFPGRVKNETYRRLIERAKEANFNMLRIWGGGIYEKDIFYDLCDEAGIMVWQDFMFACANYPFDKTWFRELVLDEAYYQVKRLRNHPGIVVWCGCNENSSSWNIKEGFGEELYYATLSGIIRTMTPGTPYVASSPVSYTDIGNDRTSGNNHDSCWKDCYDKKAIQYRESFRTPISFDSEFCIQGPVRKTSFEKFMSTKWPPDDVWKFHIMSGHRNLFHHEVQKRYSEELYGPVNNLDDFLKYGMAMHTEFIRAEFEGARRYKFTCGGTMVWMFNDCWPTSNWSILDYYGVPKPAFYAAKRACRPVIVAVIDIGREYEVYLCNDSLNKYAGTLTVGQETLDGKILWQKKVNVFLDANSSMMSFRIKDSKLKKEKGSYIFAVFESGKRKVADSIFFPWMWKGTEWPEPEISLRLISRKKIKERENSYITKVELKTEHFAKLVHLDVLPLEKYRFSDNFFDMRPREKKNIEITADRKLKPDEIHIGHFLTTWK